VCIWPWHVWLTFDLWPLMCVCVAVVTPPSGARYHPRLIDRRDGFVVVRCVPTEPGLHELSVAYDDVQVNGSPWQFNAERVSLRHWRASGAGLSHGVATAPCQFTVHSPYDKTPGQPYRHLDINQSINTIRYDIRDDIIFARARNLTGGSA